jgi:2-methylcitrate dehydratase PrpD
MANALGLACSQGGGLRPTNASPTSGIRIQSGEALRRAVHTVALARAGVTSHPGILRCPGGWFPAYSFSEPGPYRVPVAGSADNLMTRVSMKLECTPHTLVTMLDAARAIAGRRSFGADDVAAVTVRIPAQHDVISGGDKPYPTTFSEAAGHVPYCIALAMTTGSHLFPHVITAGLADDAVRKLTPRVSLEVDDGLTELFDGDPFSWPAALRVDWTDGSHDEVVMTAPETTTWTATDALEHAGLKAEVLLGGRAGSAEDLAKEFADVVSWPDLWGALLPHPLTEAGQHGR